MAACNFSSDSAGVSEYGIEFNSNEELARVKLFNCYSESLLQFATACCIIFILVGVPGNLITIVALARYRKVWNATAVFIINLHTSNLIFCSLILPMTAMTFEQRHWNHGWIMCRIYPLTKYMLNGISMFTILAISINRYIIVCHPLLYPKIYKRRNISIMLLTIWAAALAIFIAPNFGAWGRYDLEPNGGFCTMLNDKNNRSPKKFFLIIAFAGPCLTMVLCYTRIWWVVMKAAKKSQSQTLRPKRPIHLPLSHTQSDVSSDGRTLISFDLSSPGSSPTDDDTLPPSPGEKTIKTIFKTPFRLTRKEVRPKTPTSKDKKLCAMIAALMISFCVSHLPVMVTKLLYKEYKSEPVANIFGHLMEYSSNCINPIIYVLISKEYRQAYRNLFEAITSKFQRL